MKTPSIHPFKIIFCFSHFPSSFSQKLKKEIFPYFFPPKFSSVRDKQEFVQIRKIRRPQLHPLKTIFHFSHLTNLLHNLKKILFWRRLGKSPKRKMFLSGCSWGLRFFFYLHKSHKLRTKCWWKIFTKIRFFVLGWGKRNISSTPSLHENLVYD